MLNAKPVNARATAPSGIGSHRVMLALCALILTGLVATALLGPTDLLRASLTIPIWHVLIGAMALLPLILHLLCAVRLRKA